MQEGEGRPIGRKRGSQQPMRVVARFVYNPAKCERGLKAMADILAGAIRQAQREQAGGVDANGPG